MGEIEFEFESRTKVETRSFEAQASWEAAAEKLLMGVLSDESPAGLRRLYVATQVRLTPGRRAVPQWGRFLDRWSDTTFVVTQSLGGRLTGQAGRSSTADDPRTIKKVSRWKREEAKKVLEEKVKDEA